MFLTSHQTQELHAGILSDGSQADASRQSKELYPNVVLIRPVAEVGRERRRGKRERNQTIDNHEAS